MENITATSIVNGSTSSNTINYKDSKYLNDLKVKIMDRISYMNGNWGWPLDQDECEYIAGDVLILFFERCRDGIYDSSISSPMTYLNLQIQGRMQKAVRLKKLKMPLPVTVVENEDDRCGSIVMAKDYFEIQHDVFCSEGVKAFMDVIATQTSERDQKVIALLLEGASRQEMLDILSLKRGALDKLVHDARLRLRSKLEKKGYGNLLSMVA